MFLGTVTRDQHRDAQPLYGAGGGIEYRNYL
jgi:hypothetical protein